MERYLTHELIQNLIVFQAVLLLIIWSNLMILHRARQHKLPEQKPFLSILIPARNEEMNIARCIRSLLAQDYPTFEILVLDDQSNDATVVTCIGLSQLLWMIPYQQMGFGTSLALLYPSTLFISEVIAWKSLWLTITGKLSWKGRKFGRSPWRLL